ncbi:MAG: citrate lyase acyl carrier protein [Clostridia bacterium]|nr:citrate lyase acyl carrier protein [Clostridia bacterium]
MQIQKQASAGTLESSDVMVTLKPAAQPGIHISISSKLAYQYGESMEQTVREVCREFDITDADIELEDKGALDCVIRARTQAAVCRSLGVRYPWEAADK